MTRTRLVAAAAAALVLAGCSSSGSADTTVHVTVVTQAGTPLGGVNLHAQQLLGSDVRDLPDTTVTAADGTAHLTLPVNITASIGLSTPGETRWQQLFTVPPDGTTLTYTYPVPLGCTVIDPAVTPPCPTPTPTPP